MSRSQGVRAIKRARWRPPTGSQEDPEVVSASSIRQKLLRNRLVLLGIVLAISGSAAGAVYYLAGNATLHVVSTNITSASACQWYTTTNSTDDFGGNAAHSEFIWVSAGWGTSAITMQFNLSKGDAYDYLVDEVVGGCSLTAGAHLVSLSVTSSTAATSGVVSWLLVTLMACPSAGCAGTVVGGGAWTESAGSANLPNNPSQNPTTTGSSGAVPHLCDNSGGGVYGPYGVSFGASGSPNSQPNGPTYSYSLNATTPGWTADDCTTGRAAPPAISASLGAAATLAFYFLSIEATAISASASGSPSITLSLSST